MESVLPYIIRWCLVANVVAGFIVIYIASRVRNSLLHEKFLTGGIGLIVIHCLHALLVAAFFYDRPYLDWGAPYSLGYGPLLYFALRTSLADRRLVARDYILHAAPFIIYYILYIIWLCFPSSGDLMYLIIRNSLFKAIILTFFGYGLYAFYLYRSGSLKLKHSLNLLTSAGLVLLIVGFLMISVDSSSPRSHASFYIPRLMMYGMMTIVVFVVLDHKVRLLSHPKGDPFQQEQVAALETRSYAKSGVPTQTLALYEERVMQAVEGERLYLDPALNLERLSEVTKIPRHHLSQIFSLNMGKSFTDYINQLRIEHACKELRLGNDVSIEQLGYGCGFNSKVSFYRNFKLYTGSTPSQYLADVNASKS